MIPAIQGLDIYLLDQILKERFDKRDRILDAGCGGGRNMVWFAKNGFQIEGCDISADALSQASTLTGIDPSLFRQESLEHLSYQNDSFDSIICSAVLHFAESSAHFQRMLSELLRVLKKGGMLFIRMTSNFGLSNQYQELENGRFILLDGTERFLLTADQLAWMKNELGLSQIEPVKSTLVEDLRSMTTLVLMKTK